MKLAKMNYNEKNFGKQGYQEEVFFRESDLVEVNIKKEPQSFYNEDINEIPLEEVNIKEEPQNFYYENIKEELIIHLKDQNSNSNVTHCSRAFAGDLGILKMKEGGITTQGIMHSTLSAATISNLIKQETFENVVQPNCIPQNTKRRKAKTVCCVVGCRNSYRNTTPDVHFYNFPSKPHERERRIRWIQAVNRINPDGTLWLPTYWSRICSAHFVDNKKSQHPKHSAYVPTIFPLLDKKRETSNKKVFKNIKILANKKKSAKHTQVNE